jgi:Undecaprenyl-phosphate glucose phosphotransferase
MTDTASSPENGARGGSARKSTAAPHLAEIASNAAPEKYYSPVVLAGVARLLEFLVVAGTGLHAQNAATATQGNVLAYLFILSLSFAFVAGCESLGLYTVSAFRAPLSEGAKVPLAWLLLFGFAGAMIFLLTPNHPLSADQLTSWFALGAALLGVERLSLAALTRALGHNGRLSRRAVLVGGGPLADPVIAALAAQKDTDLTILGIFDDRDDERSPGMVAGYPKLGSIDALVAYARHTRVDLVLLTLPITAEARLLDMLRKLWVLPIDIRLAAHTHKLRFRPRSYSYIGDFPVIDVFDRPIADWDVVAKLFFNRIVGTLCLILASPLMALIAVAVKPDSPGPVLFRQARHGFNNEAITVYKFRSLHVAQEDSKATRHVTRDDPRVTRVGRFIRRTSLDELPQLFNVVFACNLSLVGPRPHAVIARSADIDYQEVVESYFARHRVKPGITGWAQINDWRGETDTPEKIQKRVEHDLYYIENWSIFFDIYILAATPFALIRKENAY